MEMSGVELINASRKAVWTALNDPEVLKQAIPGCQEVEKDGDVSFTATVKVKVGPVKATFKGKVTLSNIDEPNGYTITGEG
ncbi:MAG: carbon monoxide dehydrogenase subunit G, partial [Sneathiella sp.]|nr:carbon monoxide dehydrogenase subunit G [Sneathiella sp.]